MTTTTHSRIRYVVRCDGYWLGDADDRDAAEEIIFRHANRNGRQVSDSYSIQVELRDEAMNNEGATS